MPGDLPDYTRLVTVNVNIPEVQIGAVNVGIYKTSPADLPDGTRTPLITDVKGRLTIVQYEKDRTVGIYKAAPPDLSDLTKTQLLTDIKGRAIVVQLEKDRTITGNVNVIIKPEGSIADQGSLAATTASYQDVVAYTVTNTKTFHLAKIKISVEKASWIKLMFDTTQLDAEILLDDKVIVIDWFPYTWRAMVGDGAKQFKIQAKQYSSSGIVNASYCGEES